jgi:hypothetical protein
MTLPNQNATEAIAAAPMPTNRTLRRRQNIPFQFLRFMILNFRMVRMVTRGHGDTPTKH